MRKFLKFLGIITAIAVYFVLPIVINWAVGLENPTRLNVAGDDKTWISFWAVYLSGLIPFIILYFTIDYNNSQNENNRSLQLNSLSYQIYLNRIVDYKSAICEVLSVMNKTTIDELICIIKSGNINKREPFVKDVLDKLNLATNKFRITFATTGDEVENKFILEYEDIRLIFYGIIKDILWVSFQGVVDSFENSELDIFHKNLAEYKKANFSIESSDRCRVWSIVEKIKIEPETFPYAIIDRLSSCDISSLFYDKAMNFIKYENHKALKILYGTEQDK